MRENPPLQTIQALEQRLVALDRERNKIMAQIDHLRNVQPTARAGQNDTFTPEEKISLFRSLLIPHPV